ncbi:MAG: galactose mutarotase [Lachnospiraceae bacterium]|nr:galactose mutarotase [Lachnospiraceae bacterium]
MVQTGKFGDYPEAVISDGALKCTVTAFGAAVRSLEYEGKELVLGYGTPEEYRNDTCFIGVIVGRLASRIANSVMRIGETEYRLVPNENGNHLHGGPGAFDKRKWHMETAGDHAVRMTLFSPDGDNGYPGNLTATVTYTVSGNELRIDLEGESDADTAYGPTSHMYFRLDGHDAPETELQIHADRYLVMGEGNIPTGTAPCTGTFDFGTMRKPGTGLDHCFIANGEHMLRAQGGDVQMDLYSDYPGLVVYAGMHLTGGFAPNAGFAAEPGFYPDAVNHPEYPSPVLKKGDHFHKYIRYVFRIK